MKINFFSLLILAGLSSHVSAVDLSKITFNGFGSVVGTKILSGSVDDPDYFEQVACPCFITDFNSGGIISDSEDFNINNETRLGLQLDVKLTDTLSFTTQVVARTITNDLSLEWAFVTYKINDTWKFQAGRKRIPLYYFSTFQDVGLAYTWVRPPQALYGWEVSNYNGVNLIYSESWGHWDILASAYAGSETIEDAPYNDLYYDSKQDSKWDNIRGLDFEATYEWFNVRFIYLTSNNSVTDKPFDNTFYTPFTEQTVAGLAINIDLDDYYFNFEHNINRREDKEDGLVVRAPASMIGIGIRLGNWTPYMSWSRYQEKSSNDSYEPEIFTTTSLTLRYDINTRNALKGQIEKFDDRTLYDFMGDTTVLSLSYDFVF